MTKIEIALDYAAAIEAARRAFNNGWIGHAAYDQKVKQANEWKRKAECGHWDYQAYKQGA
jgi:hypothetical protein